MWFFICMSLVLIVIALSAKIYVMKKSAQEISEKLNEKLHSDTNTLIDISSSDKDLCALAANLNRELKTLYSERRLYQKGDTELKTAITNIAHDIRTPLTAVCGYLDLLKRDEMSEEQQQYFAQIQNRADAMKRLTEELFAYSVAASEKEPNLEKLCVNDVLEECVAGFYGAICKRGITPDINITEGRVVRIADKSALIRIFSNIISNALKYSSGDLLITMTEQGEIRFKNSAENAEKISVERLFDRFYTVENGSSSTGLGLSIAKLLTERVGGKITAALSGNVLEITVRL